MFKFTYACLLYGWIKSELGQTFHSNIFPPVSIHFAATSLKPGSALGEKGEKISVAKETISERSEPERESGEGKGWPFPLPNCTAGLASHADIFPV